MQESRPTRWHPLRGLPYLAFGALWFAMLRDNGASAAAIVALIWVAAAVLWASPLQARRLDRAKTRKAEGRVKQMRHGPFETERDRDQ